MENFQPTPALRQPRSRRSLRAELCAVIAVGMFVLGAAPWLRSQTPAKPKPSAAPATSKVAVIKSFRIVQEKDGPAVEILSTKPLIPAIQVIKDPDRLVIDLPNARLDTQEKRISVQADQISGLRADQFQQNPPVARVVVDLLAPRAYTWDAAGNRLVVHLGRNPGQPSSSPFQAPTVTSLTPAPQPVVTAVRAAGPLALSGSDGSTGNSFTAATDTAVLRLSSGGEVHVCPGTTVSVTPSQNRHNLMLSMNTGAMEAHFALDASSDSVMTPDFRILLVGPGEFHYAFSADSKGNTCVRALPGNTASAIVTELLGDRTYQVKATDQLVFRSGQLDRVDMNVPLECGCPPPRDPPMRATNDLPTQSSAVPPANASPASAGTPAENASSSGVPAAVAGPDVSIAPNELHVQVEAPFVFHATGPAPAPVEDVSALPPDSRPRSTPDLAAPLPPAAKQTSKPSGTETASANRPPARGFFRRLGGFFASLFH
ncbi:MAG: AMIN domain-containing protein [Acidobacteriia bacterium]|nr:AMIN domain-containing protein [Terriglobia bacterium]